MDAGLTNDHNLNEPDPTSNTCMRTGTYRIRTAFGGNSI